jgi:hypothetical protein
MSSKVLLMNAPRATAENFYRSVGTVETSVSFTIKAISNEDGSNRMCEIWLPNQEGAAGRLCIALLAPEHVDALIGALTAWKGLP